MVDIDTVLTQAARVGPVEPGRGRGGEKIAFVLQVVQQGIRPVPPDVLPVDLDKFFLGAHGAVSLSVSQIVKSSIA